MVMEDMKAVGVTRENAESRKSCLRKKGEIVRLFGKKALRTEVSRRLLCRGFFTRVCCSGVRGCARLKEYTGLNGLPDRNIGINIHARETLVAGSHR